MVTRLHKWILRYNSSSLLSFCKCKTMEQKKCYLRYVQNEDRVDIAFLLKVKEDNIRQFNLSRRPSESLESILARIGTNIQKVLQKGSKKKAQPTEGKTVIDANFYVNENIVDNTKSCIDLFDIEDPVTLKITDFEYEAVFNPPWVLSLSLPRSILAGFPIYPEHFATQNTEDSFNTFKWYKGMSVNEKGNKISETHIKWEFLQSGFPYTPSTSDIGMKLKLECIPGNSSMTGPVVEVLATSLVEAGPGRCPFENRHAFTSEKLQSERFRCVTYNILADLYCDSDFTRTVLHPYCPPYALHIDYRKQLIIKELLGYNADIMCLQEVDAKIFNHCLNPLLSIEGFDGCFYKKGKQVAEGLGCFYRRDRFSLISEHQIVLSEVIKSEPCFKSIWESIKDNAALLERLLDRSTASSCTILQSADNPEQIVVVGNTHLYFHPDADHIRLLQGGMFIYWLRDIVKKTKEQFPNKTVSLILCGDFNSVPSCGIYQLYTTGLAPSDLPDWKSNESEAVTNLTLQQDIGLSSACGTPQYTNFTAGFADCLDYIFYDNQNLTVDQVIPFPTVEELQAHTALPSIVFPSDHIALIADLKFTAK
ncbi:unnamed protein product [Plutella xylostella]|uniref:2',5'-phosphodiesterase 12 n=1 Tax=Plutella xylostella TaxID=51655 RepID=A0A8S4DJ00_PLUXY|nr:unnamed protein product [Plutella xylostella]